MNAQLIINIVLCTILVAAAVPLIRGNINKDTVLQQAQLIKLMKEQHEIEIKALKAQNKEQQKLIDGLFLRVKMLEADDAREARMVQKRSSPRDGRRRRS